MKSIYIIVVMSLGQVIRKQREKLGLTLEQVSISTGFSKPYLSTIETGKVRPPGDILLGKLEKVEIIEDIMLEIRGARGIIRIEISREHIGKSMRRKQ